ncbi:MAG: hypothetical protein KZQ60_08910 [Candidatus Thiodiazotropha sp. (ex Lucinoma aequizonata)]|nr:hypothetical protein [Candidatus Thiodiazotropha sp. (ex Lucinoma aequizonata)]MCU7889457.1 hypothetical protein [Candidatus Thiodiazotropha sp. (ex Lucinoma aequizonata)]MCU7913604.1 hypothetical protein [Candidatus Thiodiazotropha sp. (ex Lucinoma aequizonata)]
MIGDVLKRFLQLVEDLYAETEILSEGESELQLWYDRGYADGMVSAMRPLDDAQQVDAVDATGDSSLVIGQELLPWGKAYQHGFDRGEKEITEIPGASRTVIIQLKN